MNKQIGCWEQMEKFIRIEWFRDVGLRHLRQQFYTTLSMPKGALKSLIMFYIQVCGALFGILKAILHLNRCYCCHCGANLMQTPMPYVLRRTLNALKGSMYFLQDTKHNVHRFTLNLHSLKIMMVESFPLNITC